MLSKNSLFFHPNFVFLLLIYPPNESLISSKLFLFLFCFVLFFCFFICLMNHLIEVKARATILFRQIEKSFLPSSSQTNKQTNKKKSKRKKYRIPVELLTCWLPVLLFPYNPHKVFVFQLSASPQ